MGVLPSARNIYKDMTGHCTFGTKAATLSALRGVVTSAEVPPFLYFTVAEWRSSATTILQQVSESFSTPVIVRSSASDEDGNESSKAGAYDSIPHVDPSDLAAIRSAIETVIHSYRKGTPADQILVQQQVSDISVCGVVFTRSLDTDAPYYVINYDDRSGNHDLVTSGRGGDLKTYVCFKAATEEIEDRALARIVRCASELESLFACDRLDIEFAITRAGVLQLLQVRRIAAAGESRAVSIDAFGDALLKINKKAKKLSAAHPGLCGSTGMYSVMTDWNPAEMIGVRPRRLALSLYKTLITDGIWAYQRHKYGYRDLRGFPLLISFMGLPYIDVRVSFNSFVPKALDEDIARKLVDYYMNELASTPTQHDKVEFNIVFSCYDFLLPEKLKKLLARGFSELEVDRLKFSLLDLTNAIIDPSGGPCEREEQLISQLDLKYSEVCNSTLPLIDKIYWLVQDCARYGTLPFAGLARAGFIAMQMLRSLVETGILANEQQHEFMASLDTVTKRLSEDVAAYSAGAVSKAVLVERYGHLRPGTYDLLSPTYAEDFDRYFSAATRTEVQNRPFTLDPATEAKLHSQLRLHGLSVTPAQLMKFLARAIVGREYSKFVFTRSLSKVLDLVKEFGRYVNVSPTEMANVDIDTILKMYSVLDSEDAGDTIRHDIARNKDAYELTKLIRLPQLIQRESDVYRFFMSSVEPNFITHESVKSEVLREAELEQADPSTKIVFIESADPGYDWLFARNIAGLITLYGGANSHMAIRCAELKIPAVIGCGEQNFAAWSQARTLEIDCLNQLVRVLA